jgi:hypothetical protein
MIIETVKLNCSESFSLLFADSEVKVCEEILIAGDYKNDIYKGFLYFNLSMIPSNVFINYAVLKIYIQRSEINARKAEICLQPLFCDYSNTATAQSEENLSYPPIKLKINPEFQGLLAINILDIAKGWQSNALKNYGLFIFVEKNLKSLFTLTGATGLSNIADPSLTIGFARTGQDIFKNNINAFEQTWKFRFCETELSPPICVELMKQGIFYINNNGCNIITAVVEISADLTHWVKDAETVIKENKTNILSARYFGKFNRIRLCSSGLADAQVKFIGQYYV